LAVCGIWYAVAVMVFMSPLVIGKVMPIHRQTGFWIIMPVIAVAATVMITRSRLGVVALLAFASIGFFAAIEKMPSEQSGMNSGVMVVTLAMIAVALYSILSWRRMNWVAPPNPGAERADDD